MSLNLDKIRLLDAYISEAFDKQIEECDCCRFPVGEEFLSTIHPGTSPYRVCIFCSDTYLSTMLVYPQQFDRSATEVGKIIAYAANALIRVL